MLFLPWAPYPNFDHLWGPQGAVLAFVKINYVLHIEGYLHVFTKYFDITAFSSIKEHFQRLPHFHPWGSAPTPPLPPPTLGPHAFYETLWVQAPRDDIYQI